MKEVIQFLEHVQEVMTSNLAVTRREIETPNVINNNEIAQRHLKELLAKEQHESECLDVVIAMLKDELEWENSEVYEHIPQEGHIEPEGQEVWGKVDEMLAAIRKRRAELKAD